MQKVVSCHLTPTSLSKNIVFDSSFPPTPVPRALKDINIVIKEISCKVSGFKEGTGFFINNSGLILSCFHCVFQEKGAADKGFQVKKLVDIMYHGQCYKAYPVYRKNISRSRDFDYCFLQINTEIETPFMEIGSSRLLDVGDDIFFSGFPLSLNRLTFHGGTVSGLFQGSSHEKPEISIDGNVVKGFSGAAVVVQKELFDGSHTLFIIGMVQEQVVQLEERFKSAISQLEFDAIASPTLRMFTQPHHYATNTQHQAIVFLEIINSLLNNVSTGVGSALPIELILEELKEDFFQQPFINSTTGERLEVGKKKKKKEKQALPSISILGQKYYLHADNHGKKHTNKHLYSKSLRELLKATKEGSPATFLSQCSYTSLLDRTIKAWALSGRQSNFLDFEDEIGVDNGEKTSVIELYYGGEIGSHIRPKATSMIPHSKLIIKVAKYEN